MSKIVPLRRSIPITEQERMTLPFVAWAQRVTELEILSGTGSPEGVIDASVGRLYMDENGTAGSILYIKRDADISGDTSRGWILT